MQNPGIKVSGIELEVKYLPGGQWECSFVSVAWSIRRRGNSYLECVRKCCIAMTNQLVLLGSPEKEV